ncbi:MAG TPA: carboxypeptidase-like regulatory domain-containing protein, partial [Pyrinomonadaceae bacterium]|nr:carboxypeptidase-like regulatory domain-containing protein [Pyrinomonadaceae bacterium]
LIAASAYDHDSPTYFPSATRDTASEVVVREGEEITADIQYRAEPGHVVSGQVQGIIESQSQFPSSAAVTLIDVRDRSAVFSAGANSRDNFGFAFSGVPNGEYELWTTQFLQSRDELRSPPRRVTVRDADVTGVILTLARQATIEGRLVFEPNEKTGCGKRRETAAQETVVYGRRYDAKETNDGSPNRPPSDVAIVASNHVSLEVGDATGAFTLRNLPPGQYRIDPRPPASGWFLRSITIGPQQSVASRNATARDGLTLKSGERFSGLTVTMTEGAASIRGRVTVPEGQRLPTGLSVYVVPVEKENAADVLQFFETRVEADGAFVLGNIAPGKYWLVARETEASKTAVEKHIRRDSELRSAVLREAEKIKKEIPLKPCERVTDYELLFQP